MLKKHVAVNAGQNIKEKRTLTYCHTVFFFFSHTWNTVVFNNMNLDLGPYEKRNRGEKGVRE